MGKVGYPRLSELETWGWTLLAYMGARGIGMHSGVPRQCLHIAPSRFKHHPEYSNINAEEPSVSTLDQLVPGHASANPDRALFFQ